MRFLESRFRRRGGDPAAPAFVGLVIAAVCAFAANSVLCRLALEDGGMAPLLFTALRMLSGAAVLATIVWLRSAPSSPVRDPVAALSLFVYAECFAWAYIELDAGAGALLLFGAVQVTMVASGLWRGERLSASAWAGLLLATLGLAAFFRPDTGAGSALAAAAMLAAGGAWGVYSLRGGRRDPVASTAWNFILVAPVTLVLALVSGDGLHVGPKGALAAVASGALASALGYVLWYRAVRLLSAIGAASAQLSVPVVAALGGVWFLGEAMTFELVAACLAVLTGTALVNAGLRRAPVVRLGPAGD